MLTKPIEELTLDEINEELEFRGIERRFKRIDHARKFLTKEENKSPVVTSPIVMKATKKVEKVKYSFTDESWAGSRVFTPGGTATVIAFDPDAKRFLVEIRASKEQKHYAESSVRFKAVDDRYREKYVHDSTVRTESGSTSVHKGDDLSYALLGLTEAEIRAVAIENGLEERYDIWVESDLSPGMRRMNVGNMLRAKLRKGERISIFGRTDMTDAAEARRAQIMREG